MPSRRRADADQPYDEQTRSAQDPADTRSADRHRAKLALALARMDGQLRFSGLTPGVVGVAVSVPAALGIGHKIRLDDVARSAIDTSHGLIHLGSPSDLAALGFGATVTVLGGFAVGELARRVAGLPGWLLKRHRQALATELASVGPSTPTARSAPATVLAPAPPGARIGPAGTARRPRDARMVESGPGDRG